jgi:signal transduction histidine kinase
MAARRKAPSADGVVEATLTLGKLISAITAVGGPTYAYRLNTVDPLVRILQESREKLQELQRLRENKRLEERLREAEHLSAVGQLSRSIAHEIRNPLNFISLSIDHIREKYPPSAHADAESFDALLSSVKQEIRRLNNLVSDFLDYGKPLRLNIQLTQIDRMLDDVVEIIRAKAAGEGVEIKKQYEFSPDIMVDPELMKTCIMNVLATPSRQRAAAGNWATSHTRSTAGAGAPARSRKPRRRTSPGFPDRRAACKHR